MSTSAPLPATTLYRWESADRYYVAWLARDLLGDWVLARAWGGLGNRLGGHDQTVMASPTEAPAAIEKIDQTRLRHGYQRQP